MLLITIARASELVTCPRIAGTARVVDPQP